MRVSTVILSLLILSSILGCSTTGRRPAASRDTDIARNNEPSPTNPDWWNGNQANNRRDNSNADPKNPDPTRVTPAPTASTRGDLGGLLAGRVLDINDSKRPLGKTFIQFVLVDEANPTASPKENAPGVLADEDGGFVIQGLRPGRTYNLMAVLEDGSRRIAGSVQAKPPSSRLLIRMTENNVSSITPVPPPPAGSTGPFSSNPSTSIPDPNVTPSGAKERGWGPGEIPPAGSNGTNSNPTPPPTRPIISRPDHIAGDPPSLPAASISGNRPPPPSSVPANRKPAPMESSLPSPLSPNRTVGQQVPNFVLNDIYGREWEFRNNTSRLILIDFRSTSCVPCIKAMPAIKKLQTDYGTSGLEVVGVACEIAAPLNERAKNIEAMARKKELNYHVYLEREGKVGEVQRLFKVEYVPTFVLLDHYGNVLFRGGASPDQLARLEEVIKVYLTRR